MTPEFDESRPTIQSISKSERFLTITLGSRGGDVTLREKISNPRADLQKVFSDDVTDIILGETQIPDEQREATLAKISEQYRQRVSNEMAKKSFQ